MVEGEGGRERERREGRGKSMGGEREEGGERGERVWEGWEREVGEGKGMVEEEGREGMGGNRGGGWMYILKG